MIGKRVWSLSVDMTFPNHTLAKLEPGLLYQYAREKPAGVVANRNATVSCEPLKILRTVSDDTIDEEEVASVNLVTILTIFCELFSCQGGRKKKTLSLV